LERGAKMLLEKETLDDAALREFESQISVAPVPEPAVPLAPRAVN
jgi:hypothetical protein